MDEMMAKQLNLEICAVNEGIKRYNEALKSGRELPPHFGLLKMGIDPLRAAIKVFMLPKRGGYSTAEIRKVLADVMAPEELAYITLWTMITAVAPGASVQKVSEMIGEAIRDQLNYKAFQDANPGLLRGIESNMYTKNTAHRKKSITQVKRKIGIADVDWDKQITMRVGEAMLQLLNTTTGMWEIKHRKSEATGHTMLLVYPAEKTAEYLQKAHRVCARHNTKFMPCIIPPKPWTAVDEGGYWSGIGAHNMEVVKTRHREVVEEIKNENLSTVYTALNALQETAWTINKRILEVVNTIWDSTDGLGLLPSPEAVIFPSKAWNEDDPQEFEQYKKDYPEEFKAWLKATTYAHKEVAKERDKARAVGHTLGRARMFSIHERFYFPWSCDYRGRVYPTPLYLNPQGDDLQKGLLQFADGVRLGKAGVKWLAIHGANSFGEDKLSLKERVQWVYDHQAQILDCAANPLDGSRFWMDADDPWQFLAFCFEWAGVAKQGENFVSYLSVSVDGSCNGLQNFAGLLRDERGGQAVNLVPQEKPNDIYMQVCLMVIELVRADLESKEVIDLKKEKVKYSDMAQLWMGKIDRKIVKRGVMTTPYGVTMRGLKDQLLAEMFKRGSDFMPIHVREWWKPAYYLSLKLAEAISKTVVSASVCMDWLKKVAALYNKADLILRWTTPTGWRCVQKYVREKLVRLNTYWGEKRFRIGVYEDTDKIDKAKQSAAISPNLIHSLDASHLVMTVNAARAAGITSFGMIHDSYGCHAGHMEDMSRILREQFVALYSQDLITNLKEQFMAPLPEDLKAEFPEPPAVGSLDLRLVLESHYFFA